MTGPSPLFPPGLPPAAPPRGVGDLVAALYRQAGLVLVCVAVGTAASAALYLRQPRVYTSSAKVWVQTEQQGSPSFLSGIAAYRETPYPDPVNRKIETEIELMLTRANAQAVIDKLGITAAQLSGTRAKAPAAGGTGPKTVDLFLGGVSVEPLRSKTADTSSNVLEVTFECADPVLAPQALQAFLDNYLQVGAQQNRRLGERTAKLIGDQLVQAKDELRQAEDQIVAVLVKGGGRAADVSAGAAGRAADAYAAPEGGLKLDLGPDAVAGAGSTSVVATLKSQTLALQQRLDEARQTYTDDSENVRTLRAQLAGSKALLARTVRDGAELDAELNRLERVRQLAQERFVELQRKLDQIDLYLRLNPTEAESRVVIDAPDHPGAAEGKKKKIVALMGPVGGLLLGLLLATLRELGGGRLRSAREVRWALGVPVLGAIPTLSNRARQAYLDPVAGARAAATERA